MKKKLNILIIPLLLLSACGGGSSEDPVVTVPVKPPVTNTAPIAVTDSALAQNNLSATIDVLANDMPENVTIISVDDLSSEGFIVSIENATILYTPTNSFTGMDEFEYTIEDANGNQSSATVALVIEAKTVNSSSLEAIDDVITVNIGSENITIDVLDNDNYGVNGMNTSIALSLESTLKKLSVGFFGHWYLCCP